MIEAHPEKLELLVAPSTNTVRGKTLSVTLAFGQLTTHSQMGIWATLVALRPNGWGKMVFVISEADGCMSTIYYAIRLTVNHKHIFRTVINL